MSYDRNYTSQTSERLADGTVIQYTRFWSAEEIAQRKAEEAAWQREQGEQRKREIADLTIKLIEARRTVREASEGGYDQGVCDLAESKASEIEAEIERRKTEEGRG